MANIVYKRSPPASRRGILNLAALQAAQAHHVIVFRPGGTAGGNVYVTWAAVVAELAELDGPKVVYFDDDLAACEIPSGAWDCNGATFAGDNHDPLGRVVTVVEGAVLQNLAEVTDGLDLTFSGTAPPITLAASGKLRVDQGARLKCGGAGPLVKYTSGGALYLGERAQLYQPTGGADGLVQVDAGTLTVGTQEGVIIYNGAFNGAGNVDVTVTALPNLLSAVHANLTGFFAVEGAIHPDTGSTALSGYTARGYRLGIRSKLNTVDTSGGGPYSYNLPNPADYVDGYEEIVKDSGNGAATNNITVTCTTASGLIDGNDTALIALNNGAITFRTNGTIWHAVAQVG